MSFGKFGARPRSMSNPVYWVGTHLAGQRSQAAKVNAANRFNEKWHRLNDCIDKVQKFFIQTLVDIGMSQTEWDKLDTAWLEMKVWRDQIATNINTCKTGDLSRLATAFKKVALLAIGLCQKYKIYPDINTVTYDAKSKSICINNDQMYFLG